MTNKEAIEELKLLESEQRYDTEYTDFDCFRLAIKALEQQNNNYVYKIRLIDSYRETPREISNLIFSSYDSAERYRKENNLQDGWWSIEKIKPL